MSKYNNEELDLYVSERDVFTDLQVFNGMKNRGRKTCCLFRPTQPFWSYGFLNTTKPKYYRSPYIRCLPFYRTHVLATPFLVPFVSGSYNLDTTIKILSRLRSTREIRK